MKLNRKWLLVIALVLSMATAISGTLAYLTDTDSSVNTFTVGNVKIELTETNWDKENQPTLLPGVSIKKNPVIKNTGKTSAWVWMKVTVPTDLINYIDWNTTDWTKTTETSGTNTIVTMKRTTLLESSAQTEAAFTKVALPASLTSMPESIADSNTIDITVNAYAIQDEPFADIDAAMLAYAGTTGDDNTKSATVSNSEELIEALKEGATTIVLNNGDYQWTDVAAKNKTLKLYGESRDGVVIYNTNEGEGGADYDFDGSTVEFYNLTLNCTHTGYARMNATYTNCVIKGEYVLFGNSTFNNCTFNIFGDQYNVWTWGAPNVTMNNCTFNSDGKAVLLYGGQATKLTINNCVFNDNDGLDDKKAAIEIGNDYNSTYELIVNDTTVNGYEQNDKGISTGTTLWGNKNSMDKDHLSVTIDGKKVY